jgi:hypothetical protein
MTVEIPLYGRSGVVAHAIVDDEDAELVAAYRWNLGGGGYAVRRQDQRPVYMHRQILGLTATKDCTDHINGVKLDNRRVNLRVGTQALNNQNRASQLRASSRFRGVHLADGRWVATVTIEGVTHKLGRFWNEIDAARVVDEFRGQVMPFAEPDPELVAYEASLGGEAA